MKMGQKTFALNLKMEQNLAVDMQGKISLRKAVHIKR